MGDYQQSQDVGAPPGQLFDHLSDVGKLPRYFPAVTSAEPAGDEAVRVAADAHGSTPGGEAWLRVNRERQHLDWGPEEPDDYHGHRGITAARRTRR